MPVSKRFFRFEKRPSPEEKKGDASKEASPLFFFLKPLDKPGEQFHTYLLAVALMEHVVPSAPIEPQREV